MHTGVCVLIHILFSLCVCRSVGGMGNVMKKIFGKKDMRILMLGLDAAGKTSIRSCFLSLSFLCFCVVF